MCDEWLWGEGGRAHTAPVSLPVLSPSISACRGPSCNHGGRGFDDRASGGDAQEAHLQEVYLPRGGPRQAPRPLHGGVHGARARAREAQDVPRAQAQTHGPHQAPEEGQEERGSRGEAQGYQDPPAKHAHRARDDRLHRRYLQRKVDERRGDQARDGRPLPRRVLHHLQARAPRKARDRFHQLVPFHPAQLNQRQHVVNGMDKGRCGLPTLNRGSLLQLGSVCFVVQA